jgi:hypothetical protein
MTFIIVSREGAAKKKMKFWILDTLSRILYLNRMQHVSLPLSTYVLCTPTEDANRNLLSVFRFLHDWMRVLPPLARPGSLLRV